MAVAAVVGAMAVGRTHVELVVPLDDVVGSDLELVDAERRRRVEHELRAARRVGLRLRLSVAIAWRLSPAISPAIPPAQPPRRLAA